LSFGIKSLKSHQHSNEQISKKYFKTLLIGDDLAMILALMKLKHESLEGELKLITTRLITKKDLIDRYQSSVSLLRSVEDLKKILEFYPNFKTFTINQPTQFYKDGKWHEFSGRAKPVDLKEYEQLFLNHSLSIELEGLFSSEDWINFDQILEKYCEVRVIESCEKINATDLAEPQEWRVVFKDFSQIECQTLMTSVHPQKLLKISKQGQSLPDSITKFLSSLDSKVTISINWKLKSHVMSEGTYLIPQSMTHDWGHFIFEQKHFNSHENLWEASLLIIWQEEEFSAEDVAQKIKLSKRVLDRVFHDFEKNIHTEQISVIENGLMGGATIDLSEEITNKVPTFKYLGPGGFFNYPGSMITREILSSTFIH
jgi:hypothetical protein